MYYSYINKKVIHQKQQRKNNHTNKQLCTLKSEIFALNINLVRILKEARTARKERDWKAFGYKMYKAGQYSYEIERKESLINSTESSSMIEKLLKQY